MGILWLCRVLSATANRTDPGRGGNKNNLSHHQIECNELIVDVERAAPTWQIDVGRSVAQVVLVHPWRSMLSGLVKASERDRYVTFS